MTIARDDDALGGDQRLDGTRVGDRHVAACNRWGQTASDTADQSEISLAEAYEAMAYYSPYIDELRAIGQNHEEAYKSSSRVVTEPERTQ